MTMHTLEELFDAIGTVVEDIDEAYGRKLTGDAVMGNRHVAAWNRLYPLLDKLASQRDVGESWARQLLSGFRNLMRARHLRDGYDPNVEAVVVASMRRFCTNNSVAFRQYDPNAPHPSAERELRNHTDYMSGAVDPHVG